MKLFDILPSPWYILQTWDFPKGSIFFVENTGIIKNPRNHKRQYDTWLHGCVWIPVKSTSRTAKSTFSRGKIFFETMAFSKMERNLYNAY